MTLQRLQGLWIWLAIGASALMLATAHAFQQFGGLAPCQLCLRQREVYWAAIAVGVGGLIATRLAPKLLIPRATAGLLALAFLAGAVWAIYHAGAEYKFWPGPATCGAAAPAASGPMSAQDLATVLDGGPQKVIRCDEAPWVLFGLSMAGYNALISLALAGLSALVAAMPAQRQTALE